MILSVTSRAPQVPDVRVLRCPHDVSFTTFRYCVPSPSVLEEWSFPEQLSWSWMMFSLVECNLCRNNLGSYFQVSAVPLTFPVLLSSTPSPLSEGQIRPQVARPQGFCSVLSFVLMWGHGVLLSWSPSSLVPGKSVGFWSRWCACHWLVILSQLFLTGFSSAGFLSHEHKMAKRRHANSMMNSLFSH